MAFFNFDDNVGGFPGHISRGDQSLSRAWGETNQEKDKNIPSGIFVARVANGVKLIQSKADVIHGIVVAEMRKENKPQEQVSVAHIGHGDGIWVSVDEANPVKELERVKIVSNGEDAGKISSKGDIVTSYVVVRVNGNVAEITRNEIGV